MDSAPVVWGSLNPGSGTSVHRTGRGPKVAQEWYFLRRTEKAYHAIGRTVYGLQPLVTQTQVDDLCEEYDWRNRVSDMSISLQLDMLTTEILRQDRMAYLEATGQRMRLRYPYLSPGQWMKRVQREIPFPNVEKLASYIKEDPRFRVRNYHNRITNLAFDRQGNLPYVWTRSPMRVGKDPEWEPRKKET